MITQALLELLTLLFDGLLTLLPDWNITDILGDERIGGLTWSYHDGWNSVSGGGSPIQMILFYLNRYNDFVPIDQLWIAMNLVATFYLALIGFRVVMWLIGVIRGSGTQ